MAAKRVPSPPAFAEGTFAQRLYERVLQPNGKPYSIFSSTYFPKFVRWVKGTGEYDGLGVRDAINGNAQYLDDTNAHVVRVDGREAVHYEEFLALKAAVEAGAGSPPFPG